MITAPPLSGKVAGAGGQFDDGWKRWLNNLYSVAAVVGNYGAYDASVPVNGFSLSFADNIEIVQLAPAGPLAAGTVALPANPVDKQRATISTTQAITALTITAGATIFNPVATLGAGQSVTYYYSLSANGWYLLNSSSAGGGTGSPAGINRNVQFNDSGAFGASPTFTFNNTTLTLAVPTIVATQMSLSTPLPGASGGTGQNLYTVGDMLYASGVNALSKLADVATGNALLSGGVATAPAWGKVDLTAHVAGTLPAGNGGTGQSLYTVGDILYASGAAALSKLADIATGNVLLTGGVATAPAWGKVDLTAHITGNLPVGNLNSGTGATSGTMWRGDGTWSSTIVGPHTADRFIPASATVPTNGLYLPAVNNVALATNSTLGLQIDASQNVGIAVAPSGTYKLEVNGALSIASATMLRTSVSFTNGSGASTGTLTNAPAVGNPTKWIPVIDNGTTRYIPAW